MRQMLADGLVDTLHLFVYPLTLRAGPRLFSERGNPLKMTLAECAGYDNGVVYLAYELQR